MRGFQTAAVAVKKKQQKNTGVKISNELSVSLRSDVIRLHTWSLNSKLELVALRCAGQPVSSSHPLLGAERWRTDREKLHDPRRTG